MGMAASQGRLLALTSRKADITYNLNRYSTQKMAMAREMQAVTKEYQQDLNSKIYKWSNNGGVTYSDITYSSLMRPNSGNQMIPYILTDWQDKVVIDEDYKKYAEMISPDGAPGDWESVRTQVLSELIGIDASRIEQRNTNSQTIYDKQAAIEDLKANEPRIPSKTTSVSKILEQLDGTGTGVENLQFSLNSNYDWADAYKAGSKIKIGANRPAAQDINLVIDYLSENLQPYFYGHEDEFNKACEDLYDEYSSMVNAGIDLGNSAGTIHGSSGKYEIDVKALIDEIMGKYVGLGGEVGQGNGYNGQEDYYVWYDYKNETFQKQKAAHEAWQKQLDDATDAYNDAVREDCSLLNADEERQINFYDSLFSTVAEKGWTYNYQVNDSAYLNEMFQNNMYTLTTVSREHECDENGGKIVNNYFTDVVSNFDKFYPVNDSDAASLAQAKYEEKKQIINIKESRIDNRINNLQTELSAINQMIQGIESVRDDNTERTFGIFG